MFNKETLFNKPFLIISIRRENVKMIENNWQEIADSFNIFNTFQCWIENTYVKNFKGSASSDHLLRCDCSIDFDYFDILASDTNEIRLLIKGSLFIKRDQPVLIPTIKSISFEAFRLKKRFVFSIFIIRGGLIILLTDNYTVKVFLW